MKLGIKIAPGNAWQHDIEATHPAMVEIWYNASRPQDYDAIFDYLADKPIDVGLHFWGTVQTNILTNISYPDPAITEPSLALTYETIDKAAATHCGYVNVHPDLYSLLEVNFATMDIHVASEQADHHAVDRIFTKRILELSDYATTKGVVLTVETVPLRDTPTWRPDRDRTRVIDIHQMPVSKLIDLAGRGIAITNDICHTACNIITDNPDAVWSYLAHTTRALAAATRLIHLGYVISPYNGVDFHDSLDNPILATSQAVPNTEQMIELLQQFPNRDDVWVLVEPKEDHVKNYLLARGILEKAGVLTKEALPQISLR